MLRHFFVQYACKKGHSVDTDRLLTQDSVERVPHVDSVELRGREGTAHRSVTCKEKKKQRKKLFSFSCMKTKYATSNSKQGSWNCQSSVQSVVDEKWSRLKVVKVLKGFLRLKYCIIFFFSLNNVDTHISFVLLSNWLFNVMGRAHLPKKCHFFSFNLNNSKQRNSYRAL